MSLLDKMRMWNSKAGEDHSFILNEDLFEEVQDDEENSIAPSDLTAYHKIVLESTAYKLFLLSLKSESSLQLETSEPRIRQRILDRLPTGLTSKRRAPSVHEVTFGLPWGHKMEERLRKELLVLSEKLKGPDQSFNQLIITTGSLREAQGLTIKQYLAQTWPTNGLQILHTLQMAITKLEKNFICKSIDQM
jgi:hypothetical protein